MPKDFGDKELIWTLTTHGKTEKAYASLKNDYMIDNQVISTEVGGDFGSLRDELRTNMPPELKVEGDKQRTRQGRRAADAGRVRRAIPTTCRPRDGEPQRGGRPSARQRAATGAPPRRESRSIAPPSSIVAVERTGAAAVVDRLPRQGRGVTFSPDQMKTWTDTRAYANSPWSPPYFIPEPPPDGKWIDAGDVQGAGHLRAARRRQRRRAVHLRQRDGHRDA